MSAPGSGNLDFSDESPFLDFDPDADFDESFDFDENARMIGDIPGELHDKRKSIDGKDDDDEGGGKRREGEDKTAKKPGRKPLTSEPTSKRKAQNRAAQRAFRERKERHLKDLEVKVEDLEKASESANHENGLLRAQVERLQVELKEYRKRLSWISSNGLNRSQPIVANPKQNNPAINNHNDFQFEFPKFGDLPSMPSTNLFGNSKPQKQQTTNSPRASSISTPGSASASQNSNGRRSTSGSQNQPARFGSLTHSPLSNGQSRSPQPPNVQKDQQGSVDSLSGLFSPSILEASRHASLGGYFPQTAHNAPGQNAVGNVPGLYSNSSTSNSDSPSSSTESQNHISSIGTSPDPSLNSPAHKANDYGLNPINEGAQLTFGGKDLCDQLQLACGCVDDPIPPILNMSNERSLGFNNNTTGFEPNGINAFAQQNTFDPVLFGDYRETQDNILSQDFGAFFNDAYPLPDLGSPLHNYTDVTADQAVKADLLQQVEAAKNEEVVPDTDRPMSCNKIWLVEPNIGRLRLADIDSRDRLQSMEKFRNGEIDIDNLCSELRAKAKCSEGGAVVDKKDVDKILGVV
ncbi:DNA-binding transcription factor yap1 [Exophiala xenobiotica]|nr:DNA-binding transcription factor yap1 [Exophiala xenobiotica]KAK5291549.1 DNA-binding transcription factor yap1 [Exophiala xenobiotica]KAK5411723.1 DNA-binding transcription factor yap1 [Exophiala xenobiotica]KAK5430470.1 DNA-binding transcription factor yap1 [Exophiala xenobiotica]KAK5442999.1 DNA-binding transcription factor yap1 [Exophiala xenobiotica]